MINYGSLESFENEFDGYNDTPSRVKFSSKKTKNANPVSKKERKLSKKDMSEKFKAPWKKGELVTSSEF